jgi:hypothetical protein
MPSTLLAAATQSLKDRFSNVAIVLVLLFRPLKWALPFVARKYAI